jgi:hypothetical protein
MPFNGCFDYGRSVFIKASNLMAPQEILHPARNYGPDVRKHIGVRYLSLVFYYANLLLDDCKNRHEINIKLWRNLTLVLLQSPAFILKILLATLRSSYNYAAVKIGNITCQQVTATLLRTYEELLRCSLKIIFVLCIPVVLIRHFRHLDFHMFCLLIYICIHDKKKTDILHRLSTVSNWR